MLLEDVYDNSDLSWNMPNPNLHFFLYDCSKIIGHFQEYGLPTSAVLEEGSEANNKRISNIPTHHTFQGDLKKQTMQMFVRQLYTSDREIMSLLLKKSTKPKPLPSFKTLTVLNSSMMMEKLLSKLLHLWSSLGVKKLLQLNAVKKLQLIWKSKQQWLLLILIIKFIKR